MPPKPTCKVVKREGQRGARIDPKGCKVRTTKDAQGNKRQYNKQGQEKFKITEIKDEHVMTIAGRRQYATVVRHGKTATGPNACVVFVSSQVADRLRIGLQQCFAAVTVWSSWSIL